MRVAVFSSRGYDRHFLDAANAAGKHELVYLDARLSRETASLAAGFDAVCGFVNDRFDARVMKALAGIGVRLVALRATGFNNVDIRAARTHGVAVARVPADATAYAHRSRGMMINLAAFYEGEDDRLAREEWIAGFARALDEGDGAAYVNFLGDEGPARVRDAYPGTTWDRLVEIKRRYDPGNLFRLNQNITP